MGLDGSAAGLRVVAGTYPWSPDGSRLAYAVFFGTGVGIEVVHPDGSGRHAVVYGCAPPEVVPVRLLPHGLLPKSLHGHTLARHAFGCRDLHFARRRGC